jgi:hypothetical protein
MMGGVQPFVKDDASYLGWLAQHPDGFVLNTTHPPSASYLMLHRANCRTINGQPANGKTFTGDYEKVCGSRDELEALARTVGGEAQGCGLCRPGSSTS